MTALFRDKVDETYMDNIAQMNCADAQLCLFEMEARKPRRPARNGLSEDERRITAAKRLVARLNKLRRELSSDEKAFDPFIKDLVAQIRNVGALSAEEKRGHVLDAVEHCAHAIGEIVDDTDLTDDDVRRAVEELLDAGQLEKRARFVVGGSAKQYLYYSRRNGCGCG